MRNMLELPRRESNKSRFYKRSPCCVSRQFYRLVSTIYKRKSIRVTTSWDEFLPFRKILEKLQDTMKQLLLRLNVSWAILHTICLLPFYTQPGQSMKI